MSHTYYSSFYHCVFSTRERRPLIPSEVQPRLWNFMGGIARDCGCRSLKIGGMEDHVHLLLTLPPTVALADTMREIKHGSSRWMHQELHLPQFGWQEGYGAFSIGLRQINRTIAYIEDQPAHHRRRDFQTEFLAFLKMHRIEFDPRYVLG